VKRLEPPAQWLEHMRAALQLATDASAPRGENPRVGCVIVDDSGHVVGTGFHLGAGTAHAEVVALAVAGEQAKGATAFVTLEPCRHFGRTGPCTQALIDAGVSRVVIAMLDPTEQAGGGSAELEAAGIEVFNGVLESESNAINAEWVFANRTRRPFVIAKAAMSLDGRVAGPGGSPLAITGPDSLKFAHARRAEVQAIIVGTGTVLADDPELSIRHGAAIAGEPPLRVVVGGRAVPLNARIRNDAAPTWIAGAMSPQAVLTELFSRGVRSVLMEGGPHLLQSFVDADLVDRFLWFIAPILIGEGPTALKAMEGAVGVNVQSVLMLGEDMCITAEPRRSSA
jgi:diaminohydroxyphosphoribosylaminopyrimidine deaminase / 5-amino-6-(5-phosphoribosylamino)uracil reductase